MAECLHVRRFARSTSPAAGAYLPGEPLDNDEIARRLGCADGAGRGARDRVLAANGIRTRHYALDERGAVHDAQRGAGGRRGHARAQGSRRSRVDEVAMLATGTTQGDLIVPGFASMVHGRLGGRPMELLSARRRLRVEHGGAAGGGAPRYGWESTMWPSQSDLSWSSRALRQSRYQVAGRGSGFDAEFLRWTLSDGAGRSRAGTGSAPRQA